MVSQQMLISVALPVAAMAVIVGSVANIQDNTLAPGLDTFDAATQFGYPEVTVKTEDQLRGLTVFNMLSAQNCLYAAQVYNREEKLRPEDEEFYSNLKDAYQPLKMVDGIEAGNYTSAVELGESEFTYYNRGDVLRDALDLEGFDGVCLGGKQISITETMRKHNELANQIVTAAEFAHAAMPWNWGVGPSADNEELNRGALQGKFGRIETQFNESIFIENPRLMSLKLNNAVTVSGLNKKDATDFVRGSRASIFVPEGYLRGESAGAWDGNDPGRIKEQITTLAVWTVSYGVGGGAGAAAGLVSGGVLFAAGIAVSGPVGIIAAGAVGGLAGGLVGVTAGDAMVADELEIGRHPGILIGIDQKTRSGIDQHWDGKGMYSYRSGEDVDWREDLNAFRVRMVNVPTVMSRTFSKHDAEAINRASLQLGYNYITKRANYVICEGSQGFIQSNAGRNIENDGKIESQNEGPIYRDVVYPRIELSSWTPDCLFEADVSDNYNQMGRSGRFRPNHEFFNEEGEFRGPISGVPGRLITRPIGEMFRGGEFRRITPEEVSLRLDPDTKVESISQLLDRTFPEELGYEWWDKPKGVFYPVYAVSDETCQEYRGEYDITRMFTDSLLAKNLYDTEKEIDEHDRSHYEVIEEDGDYKVKMGPSYKVNSQLPRTYYFDRFSRDSKLVMNFTIDIPAIEHIEDDEDLNRWSSDQETLTMIFDDPENPGHYIALGMRRNGIAVGVNDYNLDNFDKIPENFYSRGGDENLAVVGPESVKSARDAWLPEDTVEDEEELPEPALESKYKLVLDKESDRMKLYMWIPTESYREMVWQPVFNVGFEDTEVNLDRVGRMKISNYQRTAGENLAIFTTLEEAKVHGSIKGC